MSENQFGHVDFMFTVDLNRNRLAVIEYSDEPRAGVDRDIYSAHAMIPLVIICSIDQNLIKYFVEAWDVLDALIFEAIGLFVEDPHQFLHHLGGPNVCIRPENYVLLLGNLLVSFFECLCLLGHCNYKR